MELTITNALAFIFKKGKKKRGRWLSELEARMARAAQRQRNLVSKTKTNKQKNTI